MFVNLNILFFNELLRKFVYSFKSRIQDYSDLLSLINKKNDRYRDIELLINIDTVICHIECCQ